jgi:hypothetical protein
MVAGLVLASVIGLAGAPVPCEHVRTTEARILTIIELGVARSATFRRLVQTLDASDVIVYIEPKFNRSALAGYLSHRVIVAGPIRYVQIAVGMHGSENRLVALVAHELQHAVELAAATGVRDSESMARLFERASISFGCGGCYETSAAIDVEEAVLTEMRAASPTSPSPSPSASS